MDELIYRAWQYFGRDLAEWLELLTAKAKVPAVPVSSPAFIRHSGIREAADLAVLNKNKISVLYFEESSKEKWCTGSRSMYKIS